MINHALAKIFREMAEYLLMDDVPFKPQAYERAAANIEMADYDLEGVYKEYGAKGLWEIPGIGKGIADKIVEYIETGRVSDYEAMKKKTPVNLTELRGVEGLGPKHTKFLYQELGIRNVSELEKAAKAHKIRDLPGFGEKSEEKILKSIGFFKKRSDGRMLLGTAMPFVRLLEKRLGALRGVDKLVVAGSVRRRRETIGDIDILIISKDPQPVMDFFVTMPEVAAILGRGKTKSSVKTSARLNVDLRVLPPKAYGAGLNYFTGSKEHNVALRELAIKKGYKLSEWGLFRGKRQIEAYTEEAVYKALGLHYIEPELRENTGEIEAALGDKLPRLVGYDDLEGDLQTQTDWTDGKNSIDAMAKAALAAGLTYIAITDHTKRLAMTGGLDEKKIVRQWKEIDVVSKKYARKIRILKGSECDILKDGSLDLPDDILAKLDVVGASVHSHFNLSKKEQTERIGRAMRNPHVDIIFHPTGRVIGRRDPYELDIDDIIKTAKETGTILEVNASPERLDLKDEHVRKCVESGIKIAINSDAHSVAHFDFLEYGIAQARRGWAKRDDVINARPPSEMLECLK
ncbi:DNA polymerase/3'-5' exonuclease PolX [Candidatus Wolfebacteria bacterium]|nr:DNA polymerase/3'-5' exonuclease PolX [Candidatus Wolfebacteria bacterium]